MNKDLDLTSVLMLIFSKSVSFKIMALEGLLTLLWFSLSERCEQLFDSLLMFSWGRWSILLLSWYHRSSLIYNTSARHEQHECDTGNTSETRPTRCNTSTTQTTRVRHECYTNDTIAILILITTQVKTYFYTPIFITWHMKV